MLYVIHSRAMFSLLVGKRPARTVFCAGGVRPPSLPVLSLHRNGDAPQSGFFKDSY